MNMQHFPQTKNYVSASEGKQPIQVRPMTADEARLLEQQATIPMPDSTQATHTGHLREDFDAMTMAKATVYLAKHDIFIFLFITLGLTGLLWFQIGGDFRLYGLGWLVLWGAISYFALHRGRGQAYHNSPAGVARHEQEEITRRHDISVSAQERIATLAITEHVKLLRDKWRLETKQDDNE